MGKRSCGRRLAGPIIFALQNNGKRYSLELEDGWRRAKTQGEVVLTQTGGARYKAAVAVARERGFVYLNAEAIEGQELVARMRALVDPAAEPHGADLEAPQKLQPKAEMEAVPPLMETRKALLGLIPEPKLSLRAPSKFALQICDGSPLQDGFERFWAHIQDEWTGSQLFSLREKTGVPDAFERGSTAGQAERLFERGPL